MRIVLFILIGIAAVGIIGIPQGWAGDIVKVPGVRVGADGSVSAPGVKVDKDGNVSAPGVKVNSRGTVSDQDLTASGGGKRFLVNDDGQKLQIDCTDKPVVVNGDNNVITCSGDSPLLNVAGDGNKIQMKGQCKKLNLTGEANQVKLALIGSIHAVGDNNKVIWTSALKGGKPVVVSVGDNNVISKAK